MVSCVFDVISKHKSKFEELMSDAKLKRELAVVLGCDVPDGINLVEEYEREMQDYASALASLEMLERELRGEVEY